MPAPEKNIVLVGFMGTGKSSVGKVLAQKLCRPLIDVDSYIEEKEKRKIREIFKKDGEAVFRAMEKEAIRLLSFPGGSVMTTGGGAVLDAENRRVLKGSGIVVALLAKPETIFERVKNSRNRPLLAGEDMLGEIKTLLEQRRPFYQEADLFFETDGKTPTQVAEMISAALGQEK